MSSSTASSPPLAEALESPAPSASASFFVVPGFLALIWGQLFWALHPTWIHGQYYDYGWIVAPIAAWFFWRRWAAGSPATTSENTGSKGGRSLLIAFGLLVLLVALTLARVLERFDPIWRVPLIFHAGVVFVATHVAIGLSRGAKASLAYFPVVLFAMTAVPWPAQTENMLIGEMTDRLLTLSAPISRMIGIPVEMSGSALIADGRVIRIDEGCSGIRSFQSLLMAGLFVGEFMLLRPWHRLLLLILSMVFGFATNTLRATVLTWIFFNEGEAAFDSAHDIVGFSAFGLAAVLLLATGHWLDRSTDVHLEDFEDDDEPIPPPPKAAPVGSD